ncbi:MAG: galactose mutarotase [Spirochaetaceae bacterium]|jgi:aldose 1-epimerase|nr:galactose mutarotase [Spirochaetaceae bacterium]
MKIGTHISRKTFGTLSSGAKVYLYTLTLGDLALSVTSFGAAWTALYAPSRKRASALRAGLSRKDDVLLGYSTLEGYANNVPFLGVTVGRFANRIGNARFSLNGETFSLPKNDGEHCLHGGRRGFDKRLWQSDAYEERDGVFVRFELESRDGDEGFPGNLKAAVCYGLTKSNEVIADYQAKVDAPCPVNLTNHAYFNLAGEGEGDILSHEVQLHSSAYIPANENLIPLGEIAPVEGTPFDFRTRKPISRDFSAVLGGYDHCFAVDGEYGALRPCAEVFEPRSGRTMRVFTTQPGVQFYAGNQLGTVAGKAGSVYRKHSGFCLETQHFPDSPNQPRFPSAVFGPDREYHEKSVFAFSFS